MDRKGVFPVKLLHPVYAVACNIHHPASYLGSDRHRYRCESVGDFHSSLQTVGAVHRHCPDRILSDMLLHLYYQRLAVLALYGQCVMDAGQLLCDILAGKVEMHVDYRSYHLRYMSC